MRHSTSTFILLLLPVFFALLQNSFAVMADGADASALSEAASRDNGRAGYLHRTWQFEDGLPHNTVHAIAQTRDGYLWVGTLEGLARFDGHRFTVFRPGNTPGLASGNIRRLLETRDGALWIATEKGLSRYLEGAFSHYSTEEGLAGNQVRELFEMEDGSLWVGTVTGLSIYENGGFREPSYEPFNDVIRAMTQHPDGTIWVAGARNLYSVKDGRVVSYGHDGADIAGPINLFRTLTIDADQALWGGSMVGLARFQDGTFSIFGRAAGLPHEVVNTVFEDSRGTLWVGTHGGLSRFQNGQLIDELDAIGHAYDVVFAITEDREGHIWIASRDGLSQLRPRPFTAVTTRDGLGHNNTMAVLEDRDGKIWAGSWGGGVQALDDGEVKVSLNRENALETSSEQAMSSDFALSLCETRNRGLWVGMDYDHGIYRFEAGKVTHYSAEQGLRPSAVRVIYEDRNENIWAGTYMGLHRYRDGKFTRMTAGDGLPDAHVSVIAEDRQGNVWFGSGGGLTRYDGGSFTTFTTADGLPADSILFLYPDNDDNLWIGTRGGGLVRLREGRFTSYDVSRGLFIDDIISIVEDEFRNLWMGSRFGVFRVSKDDLDAVDRGELDRVVSTSYGKDDGLLSIQCNGAGKPPVIRSRDGRIYFVTTKGLAVADPARILEREPRAPAIRIERLVHGGRSLDPGNVSRLSAGGRHLEVHYTALSFSAPERSRFQYKLDGFDEDWVDAGNRRAAYYSNLRPGHYTFRVKGASSEGVWNEEGAALSFYLAPRLYQTWWFLLSCVLVLGGAVFGLYSLRLRHLTRREARLRSLVNDRTSDLQAEIVERQQAEDALRKSQDQAMRRERLAVVGQLSAGMAHEFNNLLTVVQGHASLLLKDAVLPKGATDSLRSIAQSSERGALLIQQMLAFSRKQAMQKTAVDLNRLIDRFARMLARVLGEESVLTCHCGESLPLVEVDPGLIEQCLINLALNARDAMPGGGTLTVATEAVEICQESARDLAEGRSGTFVCLTVSDTGCGMQPAVVSHIFEPFFTTKEVGKGSGLGLASVYGIIQQHDGWIEVSSTVGQGTAFKIFLPASQKPRAGVKGADEAKSAARGGTETILVVEDEPRLRRLISLVLKRAGYTVLEAKSGTDALEQCEKVPQKIDLLLTDMVMPGRISGTELSRRLQAKLPGLRVVRMSGYSKEIRRSKSSGEGEFFLAKPFSAERLVETVRAALDAQISEAGGASSFSIFRSRSGSGPRDPKGGER